MTHKLGQNASFSNWSERLHSLKLTANAPENRPGPKRKRIFQPSIFRFYVSFREDSCWCQGSVETILRFFLGGGAWCKRRKGTKKQKNLMFVYMTMMAYLRYTTRLYFLVLQCICISHIPSCAFSMCLKMLSLDLLDIYIYIIYIYMYFVHLHCHLVKVFSFCTTWQPVKLP